MITSIVFITSLVLLFRYFKNSKSRIIIALLYSLFLIWYVQAVLNYGKYTLQPGQSIELRAHPNADQLGYSSELILKKNDDKKIKLPFSSHVTYGNHVIRVKLDVKEQYISQSIYENGETTDKKLSNNQKNIHLEEDGIVVNYTNKKIFDVTKSNPYILLSPILTIDPLNLKPEWWIDEVE